jgi:hypothetical protein
VVVGEFLLLRAGQPVTGAGVFVGVGLSQPVLQARAADAEVLGELEERFVTLAGELDRAAPELVRVRCGHEGHPS